MKLIKKLKIKKYKYGKTAMTGLFECPKCRNIVEKTVKARMLI